MKSPLTPSDLFSLEMIGDPQLAPDAGFVYFRRSHLDRDADAVVSAIWRVDAEGCSTPFTAGRNDRLARVAPDGATAAFIGERDEKPRIYLIATAGGEARTLSAPYEKIVALSWSPDSTRLAFVATTDHEPATARIFHDATSGARHIRALPFKSDSDGLLDGTRRHLFIIDIRGGECERLTRGDFDVTTPAWSPDGTRIAFAASIDLPEWSFASDIHVVDLKSKAVRALTAGDGPMGNPAWSHDGTAIAFTGHQHGDDGGGRFNTELLLVDSGGGPIVSLSAALDRTIGDAIIGDLRSGFAVTPPTWSDDDREIYVQVSDEGSCGIRAFARDGSAVRIVAAGDRDIFGFSYNAGAFAFAFSTPEIPSDLALLGPDGSEKRLTGINDPWLADKLVVTPKRYRPTADDGTRLDAWILIPPLRAAPSLPATTETAESSSPGPSETAEPLPPATPETTGSLSPATETAESFPLVLEVHGGPHAAYGHSFFFEFQMLAGAGCAVAYGNPRGGQSYGHAYADAITGDWGGTDADDVHRILDDALTDERVDRSRVGIAGGSYGGFMTTWLLGHSDRFVAGVSMRAVNDFVSEVGASDVGWFLERELRAPTNFSDGGRLLFETSPMRAASNISVPLLVEHSERDYRCPIDQGEQLFTLLRRLGRTQVEFVRFTGDGHELSRGGKPRNRLLRLRAIAHWFARHLRPSGLPAPVDEAGALFRPLAYEIEPQ